MITFRDFIIFLADNHCLGLYWSNLENCCNVTGICRFNQRLDDIYRHKPNSWLIHSFNWELSKEGISYWCDIDECWRKRCRAMNGSKK